MATVTGAFFGETRNFVYPLMDFNGVPSGSPVTPTPGQAPLQLTDQGDNSAWYIYGHSATACVSAAGGLATSTPLYLQIKRQDTGELWIRTSSQAAAPPNTVDLGAPLEHIAGKAGNPGYMSYAWAVPAGTRLIPTVAQLSGATPTGRSPLYLTAHAVLSRGQQAFKRQIGSKNAQQFVYRGHWTSFTGLLPFSQGSPLGTNQGATLTLPINTTQYFFIDSLYCQAVVPGTPNVWLPNDQYNPCVQEDEILVSLRDTTRRAPFTVPGFAPLWTVFGQWAARYYHPPTLYVVAPRGNLEIDIMNGPTAPVTYPLRFTIGGVLVDKPTQQIIQMLHDGRGE